MQKLVADLDHRAELVCGESGLTEAGVSLRDLLTLIDPLRLHRIVGDRDLASAAVGLDDSRHLTEDVVLLQRLNQTALELIRHSVAALGILADRECVADCKLIALIADHIPEGGLILVGRGRVSGRRGLGTGSVGDRLAGRCGKRRIECCLLLETLDLCAECLHLTGHFVVLLHCGSLHETVLTTVLFEECLCLLPQGIALAAKFHDLAHIFFSVSAGYLRRS